METLSSRPRTPEGNTVGRRPDNPGPSCEARAPQFCGSAETEFEHEACYENCLFLASSSLYRRLGACYRKTRPCPLLFLLLLLLLSRPVAPLVSRWCPAAFSFLFRVDLASG